MCIRDSLTPIFAALAPGAGTVAPQWRKPCSALDHAPLRPGVRATVPAPGANGAGHFVKMVHNGIEYGVMAAYAEGLNVLRHANVGKRTQVVDAETTPLRHPELYQFDMNLPEITEVWRRGSVIASWLLDLTAGALLRDPELAVR